MLVVVSTLFFIFFTGSSKLNAIPHTSSSYYFKFSELVLDQIKILREAVQPKEALLMLGETAAAFVDKGEGGFHIPDRIAVYGHVIELTSVLPHFDDSQYIYLLLVYIMDSRGFAKRLMDDIQSLDTIGHFIKQMREVSIACWLDGPAEKYG
ncbi:hypothetical protein OESDEN_00935 [Oesophagostomum dentatum]|uniref:Uncharacterized protein n=1 Tax=Oesophagostomum dentatum TaxID=61180 RepID=A0A0B1TNH6_OESDE|nr:hypothetical protein OESDEN_00935 [Oesophagostomum dentatum]